MNLIDEQGRIFGLVNVIDALAVLLVLAVVTAGAALVFSPDAEPGQPDVATTQATIDLGPQPGYVVDAIQTGDSYAPTSQSTLTVTSIHLTPRDGKTHVLLGVEFEGTETEDAIRYAGSPLRLGRTLKIVTDSYQVSGTLVDRNSAPELTTSEVVVSDTVRTSTASAIGVGDAYFLGGHPIGSVESVVVYGTEDPGRKRVFVGLRLQTRVQNKQPTFAGTPLRLNATIPFETADYRLNGTIERTGALEQRGISGTRSVTLRIRNVPPERANSIHAGMKEVEAGHIIAEVLGVERSNATVILTSRDGRIYERDHPVNEDVTITAALRVRQTTNGLTFKGQHIQQGSPIVLDLGSFTIRATVVSL